MKNREKIKKRRRKKNREEIKNYYTNVKYGKCRVSSQDDILIRVVAEQKHSLKRVDFHHFIFDLDNLNFGIIIVSGI